MRYLFPLFLLALATQVLGAPPNSTLTEDQEPFGIFGNSYYVGTRGVSVVLITSESGHVLLDAALPESTELIKSHIAKLGFHIEDIKGIVNSHAHGDHAGGIAELQRVSGAKVFASPAAAAAIQQGRGGQDDPQFDTAAPFPPARHVQVVADNQTLNIGSIAITAHYTPGHTRGGTSWTWKECEGKRCLNMVLADSLSAVSSPGFKFSNSSLYPNALTDFEHSFAVIGALRCDILLTVHPEAPDVWERLGKANALVDNDACRRYVSKARERLAARIEEERR
jgi:metallo-beta-lactamase class B